MIFRRRYECNFHLNNCNLDRDKSFNEMIQAAHGEIRVSQRKSRKEQEKNGVFMRFKESTSNREVKSMKKTSAGTNPLHIFVT